MPWGLPSESITRTLQVIIIRSAPLASKYGLVHAGETPDMGLAYHSAFVYSASNGRFLRMRSAPFFLDDHPGYSGQVLEVADFAIGSGLNSFGDGVILRNAASNWVDAVSYGASTAAFSPSVPTVAAGQSI